MGAAVPTPSLLLEATRADDLCAEGPEHDRVVDFARRYLTFYGLSGGAHFRVQRALPAHAGLGSGTQLALATARALAELYGLPTDVTTLARVVQRAQRSAIGTWTFAAGGFVLEGGRRDGSDTPAPLLARFPIPERWHCVVAVPRAEPGMSGEAEVDAFARLPLPPERETERVAHLVLMQLLPALAEGDLFTFGAALTEVQLVTGRWFAPVQGGAFAPGPGAELIARMAAWGAAGVGQSSWGPAVYGIVGSEEHGQEVARRLAPELGDGGRVEVVAFDNEGARVERA
jgi:beta-RFAP synthase